MRESFKEILTGLFSGNRSAAEQTVENISQMNTDNLSDEWERIRQDRANYDLKILRKTLYQ